MCSSDLIRRRLLKEKQKTREGQLYLNTVESSLEASRSALKAGCFVKQCAVGDKWILWDALLKTYQWKCNFFRNHIKDPEFSRMLLDLENSFKNMEEQSSFDALELSFKIKNVDDEYFQESIQDPKILEKLSNESNSIRLLFGSISSFFTLRFT